MDVNINKGQLITLDITDINNLGCGVGKASDGRVVFVKGAVSGDTVSAEIIKVNKSFIVAKLREIVTASAHRSEERFCDAPFACGGCVYRHISYDYELEIKKGYVKNAFIKAGLPSVRVLDVRSTEKVSGYRNKGLFPITRTKNGTKAGFYAAKSHSVIPIDRCMLQNDAFAEIVRFVCRFADDNGWSIYNEESGKGLLRHVYLRAGESTGEIMLCLVINGEELPSSDDFVKNVSEKFPNVVGIVLSINTCEASSKITTSNRFFSSGNRLDTFSGERSQQGNNPSMKSE